MIRFQGLIAPVATPTGDGRMFAAGKMTHRNMPLPLMVRFGSGGHEGATVVGKITDIYDGPGGYWAKGEFLDPGQVPEVAKAVYMLQNKVMGPSVDIDRDFTVKAVPHPKRVDKKAGMFEEYNVIGVTLVPMPAFGEVHLAVENDVEKTLLASAGVDVTDLPPYFDVNPSSWKQWKLAPREYKFDADNAVQRIAHWAGVGSREPDLDRYASAFLWRNGSEMGATMAQDSFRLPLADIINGEPYLIYHAVYAAAALLSGAHGGLPNIPDQDKRQMMEIINEIYPAMAASFGDPQMKSPFAGTMTQAAIDSSCGCSEQLDDVENVEGEVMTLGELTTGGGTFASQTYTSNGPTMLTIGGYPHPVSNVVINFQRLDGPAEQELEAAFAKRDDDGSSKEPYGDVEYADPGYQEDGKKRYPLDSEKHCRAAWSYINMPKNAAKYTPEQLKEVKGRIREALKRYGVDTSDESDTEMAATLPHLDVETLLAGAGPLAPPAEWFSDPKLTSPTRLTITDDGRVFGHLAQWKVCHTGIGNKCVLAPKTKTNYRHFRIGSVLTDDGSEVEVGKITLGTGHANHIWGVMPSREHYDNSGWAAAVVNVGEDKHGIWVSGSLTNNMTPERIAELRRSPLSGDWREVNGNLELIAALAVNNPGFPVFRENDGRMFSMTSVGMVGIDDMEDLAIEHTDDESMTEASMSDTVPEMPADDVIDDAGELAIRMERIREIEADREEYLRDRRMAQLAALDEKHEAYVG